MLNEVNLIGHVGKDAVVKTLENGTVVANFSVATDESYKDKDGNKVQQAGWHEITTWGKLAELAGKMITKGRLLYVKGRLKTRTWDDKESGAKRKATEVVASEFLLLDKKTSNGNGSNFNQSNSENNAPVLSEPVGANKGNLDDDLPF